MAGLRRGPAAAPARGRGFRRHPHRPAACGSRNEGPGAVCRVGSSPLTVRSLQSAVWFAVLEFTATRNKESTMSSAAVSEVHAFEAAKQVGREPHKVKDLGLAEFGRKEIRLAEHEMPGLMALRTR